MVILSSHGCDPCCGDFPVAPGVMEDELVAPARYPAGIQEWFFLTEKHNIDAACVNIF